MKRLLDSVPSFMILMDFLLKNQGVTGTILFKSTGITYCHVSKLLNIFLNMGLIYFKQVKNTKEIYLTKQGIYLAKSCSQVMEVVNKK